MQAPVGIYTRYSTSHQLIELYHRILLALEAKQVASDIYSDISKAFDTVWVSALLYKLGKYGIKVDLLCWLNSYLSNRTQRVMIKDALSGIGHLHAGVPQGSVLGPLMFLIFINDITDEIVGLGRLFADDTSIGHITQDESTLRNMINTDLNYLKIWSNRWLLKFNPTKTEIIIFNVNGVECNLTFNFDQTPIDPVHTHCKIESASKQLNVLRKLKYVLTEITLKKIT